MNSKNEYGVRLRLAPSCSYNRGYEVMDVLTQEDVNKTSEKILYRIMFKIFEWFNVINAACIVEDEPEINFDNFGIVEKYFSFTIDLPSFILKLRMLGFNVYKYLLVFIMLQVVSSGWDISKCYFKVAPWNIFDIKTEEREKGELFVCRLNCVKHVEIVNIGIYR